MMLEKLSQMRTCLARVTAGTKRAAERDEKRRIITSYYVQSTDKTPDKNDDTVACYFQHRCTKTICRTQRPAHTARWG